MEVNIVAVIRESIVMMILVFCSVIVVTFFIERWLYLRRCTINAPRFMTKIENLIADKSFDKAIAVCEKYKVPLSRVILAGLIHCDKDKESVEDMMSSVYIEERAKMERFIPVLGTMGAVGPLLGLLGTVTGLVRAFRDLALSGSAGPSVVAGGISEALYTTVAGLSIAIPAVLFYNMFSNKVKKISSEIETNSKRFTVMLFETKTHGKEKDI